MKTTTVGSPVFDFVEEGEAEGGGEAMCWIVVECVPSRSLAQIVADSGPRSPENILVTGGGVARLTDFGIARALRSDVTLTHTVTTGVVQGKPKYLAPESSAKGRPADEKADVFSLGASLFAAVEGQSPYGAVGHPRAYVAWAMEGHLETAVRSGELAAPLAALLELDPRRRPRTSGAGCTTTTPGTSPRSPSGCRVPYGVGGAPGDHVRGTGRGRRGHGRDPRPRARRGPRRQGRAVRPEALRHGRLVGRRRRRRPYGQSLRAARHHLAEPLRRYPARPGLQRAGPLRRAGAGRRRGGARWRRGQFLSEAREFDGSVPVRRAGNVRVASMTRDGDECERYIATPDRRGILVIGERCEAGAPDPCALADAATDYAVTVLDRGPVPRRPEPWPATALARLDACALLDAAALQRVPDLRTRPSDRGFADWTCEWAGADGDKAFVQSARWTKRATAAASYTHHTARTPTPSETARSNCSG